MFWRTGNISVLVAVMLLILLGTVTFMRSSSIWHLPSSPKNTNLQRIDAQGPQASGTSC